MSALDPIADIPDSRHKLEMRLATALKWTLPVWLITMSAVGALLIYTGFVSEIGTAEVLKRFVERTNR